MALVQRLIDQMKLTDGLTDRQLTDLVVGVGAAQQPVNIACRGLVSKGVVLRQLRADGKIGNYLTGSELPAVARPSELGPGLSEDELKVVLCRWLEGQGYAYTCAMGSKHGCDIEAEGPKGRWLIEVKGAGSRNAMRVNYFLTILGELLQRMNDPKAKYSIALPDLQQYRRLWERLPELAKERTKISALFVSVAGDVLEKSAGMSSQPSAGDLPLQ